jgi:hypothetical protein
MDSEPQTPTCCGQPSKWVEISVNLKYHFCEKCKNEVVATATSSPYADAAEAQRGLLGVGLPTPAFKGRAIGAPASIGAAYPYANPSHPPTWVPRLSIGDRVEDIRVNVGPGTIVSIDFSDAKYVVAWDYNPQAPLRHPEHHLRFLPYATPGPSSQVNPVNKAPTAFHKGDQVLILRGVAKGRTGVIEDHAGATDTYKVRYDHNGGWDAYDAHELTKI